MAQRKKPSQQNPEPDDKADPSLKEPYGPQGYRSGIDDSGKPTRKNPGHTNPAHHQTGQERSDSQPAHPQQTKLEQSQEYPGIVGDKARALKKEKKPPPDTTADTGPTGTGAR